MSEVIKDNCLARILDHSYYKPCIPSIVSRIIVCWANLQCLLKCRQRWMVLWYHLGLWAVVWSGDWKLIVSHCEYIRAHSICFHDERRWKVHWWVYTLGMLFVLEHCAACCKYAPHIRFIGFSMNYRTQLYFTWCVNFREKVYLYVPLCISLRRHRVVKHLISHTNRQIISKCDDANLKMTCFSLNHK